MIEFYARILKGFSVLAISLLVGSLLFPPPAHAAEEAARDVAQACPERWESQACFAAVSGAAHVMVAEYLADLQRAGQRAAVEHVKEHCAAATASAHVEVPPAVMPEIYTVCANTLYEASEQSGIEPDLSRYQLLLMAVLCLTGDENCALMEEQLAVYR